MNKNDLLSLSGKEINTIIAVKIMGWIPSYGNWWLPKGSPGAGEFNCNISKVRGWLFQPNHSDWGLEYNGKRYCSHSTINWNPQSNLENAFELEEKIKELGLTSKYLIRLSDIVKGQNEYELHFNLVHATPKQRALAVIATICNKNDIEEIVNELKRED